MDSFLYMWVNITDGRMYIGVHKGSPDDGYICSSKLMLEDYTTETFKRVVLMKGSYDHMLHMESILLRAVDAKTNPMYYNMHNGDGKFYNKQHTRSTKKKMSLASKGKKKSIEHVDKMKKSKTGKKVGPCSEERKRKISVANRGRKRTPEFCKLMTELNNKKWSDPNYREKQSIAHKGKPSSRKGCKVSEETKLKMSLSQIKRHSLG